MFEWPFLLLGSPFLQSEPCPGWKDPWLQFPRREILGLIGFGTWFPSHCESKFSLSPLLFSQGQWIFLPRFCHSLRHQRSCVLHSPSMSNLQPCRLRDRGFLSACWQRQKLCQPRRHVSRHRCWRKGSCRDIAAPLRRGLARRLEAGHCSMLQCGILRYRQQQLQWRGTSVQWLPL